MSENSKKIYELDELILSDNIDLEFEKRKYLLRELIPDLRLVFELKPKARGHFKDIWPHTLRVVKQAKKDKIIRWAAFFHDLGKAKTFNEENGKVSFHNHELVSAGIFRKFAKKAPIFSVYEKRKIYFLVKNLGYIESYESSWTDSAVRRFAKIVGLHLDDLIELSKADITTGKPEKRAQILNKLEELKSRIEKIKKKDDKPTILPKGIGNVLIKEFNLKPGKTVGLLKDKLLKAVDDKKIEPGKEINYYIDYLKIKQNDLD